MQSRVYAFKGDIHLSGEERSGPSPIVEHVGCDIPYWLVCAGGKKDFTIKWWSAERYQQVVDHFRGRIQFVQVGANEHVHPALDGVLDLRGKTDLRDLVRWVYHAEGVLSSVTVLMHLAAAVPTRPDRPRNRACVVVAGAREPVHWEQYPFHQYLHTVGQLKCSERGGCWKSRTAQLNDGSEQDRTGALCVDVRDGLPRCMAMITPERVSQSVAGYFEGGLLKYLPELSSATGRLVPVATVAASDTGPVSEATSAARIESFVQGIPSCPSGYERRGIVICGGGLTYFTCAWVCVNMLRKLGCKLPVELWHLGPEEMTDEMRALAAPLGVKCVDGREVRKQFPVRTLNGWELKPFAILHSAFREVLFLDADNVPVRNPEYLFDAPQYRETGAIFWPDYGRLGRDRAIWRLCAVEYRDEPEFESGQIVVNKETCWKALNLTMFLNEYSDFYYRHIHGDKETFHMAFRRLGHPYAMPERGIQGLGGKVMCQHDLAGERVFQHRNLAKWQFNGENRRIRDFLYEQECIDFLADLGRRWDGRFPRQNRYHAPSVRSDALRQLAEEVMRHDFVYDRVGHDSRPMSFLADGRVGVGAAGCEMFWNLTGDGDRTLLDLSSETTLTCRLAKCEDGVWRGRWLHHERMPVELRREERRAR